MNIQWYPGHMTKTRRIMEEDLKLVDAVCEILDARIPISSRNPDIDTICGSKPRMIILNRIDMADPAMVARWSEYFKRKGWAVIQTDCKSRKGINQFAPAVRTLLAEKLARYAEKGQVGRPLKLMVVGIPNVGKSTFINQIAGRKGAKAENRPGVTRGKQWVTVDQGLLLLDTPGILWPKFEDPQVGMRLAYTGAVPALGEGMRPFGPRTLPRRPTTPIMSGVATTTSKPNQFSFVIFSTMSRPPAKSAPASRASWSLASFAKTRTLRVLPVPFGRTMAPRTCWSA